VRLFRFGKKVLAAQGLVIHTMQGFALQSEALGEIQALAASSALTSDDFQSCLRGLEPWPGDRLALTDMLREEYRVWVASLDAAGTPEMTNLPLQLGLTGLRQAFYPWTLYKPNLTRRRLGDGVRDLIRRVSSPPDGNPAAGSGFQVPDGVLDFLANGRGDLFVEFILTALEKGLLDAAPSTAVTVEATRAVVALHAFEKAKGHLPADLGQLVPEYLEAVPRDSFDGKPLRYSRAKRIVYSVGSDLIDRGGSTGAAGGDACDHQLDPTFRIGN